MGFFRKITVTNSETRFQRLEMKVNVLLAICAVQALLLGLLLFTQFAEMLFPSTSTLLIIVAILGAAGYFFRARLPSLFSSVFRYLTSQKEEVKDSSDHKFQ